MEFHVDGFAGAVDMAAITDAICAIDPAALLDIDPSTGSLRVATAMSAAELTAAIGSSGEAVDALLVMQLPSNCCGGCGG